MAVFRSIPYSVRQLRNARLANSQYEERPSMSQSDSSPTGVHLEQFKYDDKIVRAFALVTLIWAVVAMLAGVFIALQLVLSIYLPHSKLFPNPAFSPGC